MAITDVFKTRQFKSDIERLTAENNYLNSLLTPEMRQAVSINAEIQRLNAEKQSVQASVEALTQEVQTLNNEIQQKRLSLSLWTMKSYIRISVFTLPSII
jgi:chromosome segregation ATPase